MENEEYWDSKRSMDGSIPSIQPKKKFGNHFIQASSVSSHYPKLKTTAKKGKDTDLLIVIRIPGIHEFHDFPLFVLTLQIFVGLLQHLSESLSVHPPREGSGKKKRGKREDEK